MKRTSPPREYLAYLSFASLRGQLSDNQKFRSTSKARTRGRAKNAGFALQLWGLLYVTRTGRQMRSRAEVNAARNCSGTNKKRTWLSKGFRGDASRAKSECGRRFGEEDQRLALLGADKDELRPPRNNFRAYLLLRYWATDRRATLERKRDRKTPVSRSSGGVCSEGLQWAGKRGVARKLTLRATGLERKQRTWISKGLRGDASRETSGCDGAFRGGKRRRAPLGADETSFFLPEISCVFIFRLVAGRLSGNQKFRSTGKRRTGGRTNNAGFALPRRHRL